MVSLNKIKPKSASMKKKEKKVKISPADPTAAHFSKEMYQILLQI